MERKITVAPDFDSLIQQAADLIIEAAEIALGKKETFTLALSGGHTPEGLYELLSSKPYQPRIDWKRVEIFFGDERCVPPESEQSNFHMATRTLLSKAPIPETHVHRMRGEIDPQQAAKEYGELLKEKFGDGGLDMILLGMGDDGHTASLFPNSAALEEKKHRCVANHVNNANPWRITLTAPFINRAQAVLILVSGKDKAARLHEVLEGPQDHARLPIQMIQPVTGTLTWLIDVPAAGMDAEE